MRHQTAKSAMKKFFLVITLLTLLLNISSTRQAVYASPLKTETSFTLSELGLSSDIVLRGPFDIANFRFNLPANWVLQSGTELTLVASSYFASNDPNLLSLEQPGNYLGALLDVYFNGSLQQSIALRTGENIPYRITLSSADLMRTPRDGSFEISFFLNASIDCDNEFHNTTVMISPESMAGLNYEEVEVNQDLHRLPWPFYQARTKTKGSAVVVVPSFPTSDEMQSALITMATFGRMTNRGLPLELMTESNLTDDIRKQFDIIFVGKPQTIPVLSEIDWPIPILDSKLVEIEQSDGIVQQANSPWNNSKAILLVSGNDDQGVVKAAQALSTGNLVTGDLSSYSIISQVNPLAISNTIAVDESMLKSTDVTLGELGYQTESLYGIGTNYFAFEFIIPPGQKPSESPQLNLEFSYSTLIDSDRSEGVVYVNDIVVGGIKLLADNTNSLSANIKLPASAFRSGLNSLEIAISLIPRDECSVSTLDGLWVTISQDSLLHMPLSPSADSDYQAKDLYSYPFPFTNDPSLGATAFILPGKGAEAWAVAGLLAYDLGGVVASPVFLLEAAYDGQINDELRKRNLILVGQPKELDIVSELKDYMPAYFDDNSNIAVLDSQQVTYRISSEKTLGYLEIFPSPWAEDAFVLGVFGTNADGIKDAGMSLLQPSTIDILRGDFATLDGDTTLVVDTRTGLGMGRISPELGNSVTIEEQPTSLSDIETSPRDYKREVLIGLIGTFGLMVMVVAVAFWLRRKSL